MVDIQRCGCLLLFAAASLGHAAESAPFPAKPIRIVVPIAPGGSTDYIARQMRHVPYKGGGPALIAVMSGEVSMYFSSVVAAAPQVKAGKLLPIAVTSGTRWPLLPDVPTVAESGLPKYEALNWIGLLAPASTSPAVLDWWNRHATAILREKDVLAQLAAQGAQSEPMSRDEFARYLRSEAAKWATVVKASGARVD